MQSIKYNVNSEKCRAEANLFYKQKKFFEALIKYNESLCFAEMESENLGLAYANRSAVYFEMNLFDKCLENIKLARDNFYPSTKLEILAKREERSKSQIQIMKKGKNNKNNSDDVDESLETFFKLSYESHAKLPCLINCLELKNNEKYGRHIITTRQLNVGDVIAMDTAQFKVIKADSRYDTCHDSNIFQRCSNCLSDNLLSLIPCRSCCKTMYCSMRCMESAYKRYHRFECEVIDELLKSGILHASLRMLFEGLSLFKDDICKMKIYLNKEKTLTIFDYCEKTLNNNNKIIVDDHNNNKNDDDDDDERKKMIFSTTISLVPSDFELPSSNNNNDYDKISSIFHSTKQLKSLWSSFMMNESNQTFFKTLLSKLKKIGVNYLHGIGSWSVEKVQQQQQENENDNENETPALQPSTYQQLIGNGFYLFCSLFNHSCVPNIQRVNVVNDKVVVIVSRPIGKGEQLFDSYRPHFNVQPKAQRQASLLADYNFQCDCEACINDYPINKYLKTFDEEVLEFIWNIHENIPFLTPTEARKQLKKLYEIVSQQHQKRHFPSTELVILQSCISNCLFAITKPTIQFP
jgi:SET and MYND domain-containing protein 4